MNVHCPQSIQTMMELKDFAGVAYHMLTPKDGKPVITVIQDAMLGSYRITKPHTRIDEKTFANLQMVNSFFRGTLPAPDDIKNNLYTGQQAYSQILPPGLYLQNKDVLITNSKLVKGTIDKAIYNAHSTGILHSVYKDYGPYDARRYMDNISRLICRWLLTAGFSVGISDLVIGEEMEKKLKQSIAVMKKNVFNTLEEVRNGKFQNQSIYDNQEFFEIQVNKALNAVINEAGKLVQDNMTDTKNRMINMIKSGSKGNTMNVSQMVICVGQQNVDGKRITYGFTDRTLPHYTKYDDGPEARGFVENSFLAGLTPQETFFHAMGGREGLIDTAVKTSDTGYTQRKLVKAMEDCKIYYDYTVRNATGSIVQFLYGEDGMEGTKIENQPIPYLEEGMTEEVLAKKYLINKDPESLLTPHMEPDVYQKMIKEPKWLERCADHFEALKADREFLIQDLFKGQYETAIKYPIPFRRLLYKIEQSLKLSRSLTEARDVYPTDLSATYVLDTIDELCKELVIAQPNQSVRFAQILIRAYLSPKPLIQMGVPKDAFDWMVAEVRRHFREAIAPPGEMVGVIAAQSIGEP